MVPQSETYYCRYFKGNSDFLDNVNTNVNFVELQRDLSNFKRFNTYSNFCPHLTKFIAQLLKCRSVLWICLPATKHHTVSSKSNHNKDNIGWCSSKEQSRSLGIGWRMERSENCSHSRVVRKFLFYFSTPYLAHLCSFSYYRSVLY